MIRPYLAILKDSFREATASRVLWIALIGIVLILLALTPFGLRTDRSVRLRQHELADPEGLVKAIAAGATETSTPAAHLWTVLNEENHKRITDWLKPEDNTATPPGGHGRSTRGRGSLRNQVVRLVNDLLRKPDFYHAESWAAAASGPGKAISDEVRTAAATATTDENQRSLQNLQLLAATYPRFIALQDDPAVTLTYGTSELIGPIDLPPEQFTRVVDGTIVAVLSIFLGFFGVFGSLLVTASVIPRTYESGEISLLMSKPISRSMLFITKFLGGCSFTLLCGAVLVTGIWLLLGLRMDLWRPQLLWCVPIYVFLFAIYYSVSALTGVVWRNPVVSLILVALFWGVLTVVNITRTVIEENVIKTRRIVDVTVAGPETFVVDGSRTVYRWNETTADWSRVFEQPSGGVPRFVQRLMLAGTRFRPVYDFQNERILALQSEISRFGGPGPGTIVSGNAEGNWEREVEATTPDSVLGLFVDSGGRVLLPGRRAIYQFVGQSDQQKQTQKFLTNMLGGLLRSPSRSAFTELQPKDMPQLTQTAIVALHPVRNSFVLFDKGVVRRMDPADDGTYVVGPSRDLRTPETAILAVGRDVILLAFAAGNVRVLNFKTLEPVSDSSLGPDVVPRLAETAPDGSRIAVLSHDDRVIVFDGATGQRSEWTPRERGQVSAIAFDRDNALIVTNGRRSLSFYATNSSAPDKTLTGVEDFIFSVYDYVVKPLHTILPKPSDMDNAVQWIVTGERSIPVGDEGGPFRPADNSNLQQDRITIDAWTPIWTNLAFIAVMLAIGCVYVSRRDF